MSPQILPNPDQKNQKQAKIDHEQRQVSEHAGISFTAHYTGEMWQKMGISHPALSTRLGRRLHWLLAPIEWLAQRLAGVSIGETLKMRQALLDQEVVSWINKHPTTYVVELAAGLSARGWRLLNQFDQISYLEVDLPDMSALKQLRAANLPGRVPEFFAADIFTSELAVKIDSLDRSRPVLFVTEGLINYFTLDQTAKLAQLLNNTAQQHSSSTWLTEIYPCNNKPWVNQLTQWSFTILRVLTKSAFETHFTKPAEAVSFFEESADCHVQVIQPSQPEPDAKPNAQQTNQQHLGDPVWILTITPNTPKLVNPVLLSQS